MTGTFSGGCLCGAAQFEIDEFLPEAAHCHCSMCRKFHGAAFASIGSVLRSEFRWTTGEDALQIYTAENSTERTFCKHCGSSLMFFSPNGPADEIEIALAAVEGDLPVKPNAHIFVGSAVSWIDLCDGLPQFEAGRDSALVKT